MGASIRKEFSGIGMWRHREDLIKRLDHILGELARGFNYLEQHKPWLSKYGVRKAEKQYKELKEILLKVDGEAMDTLARMSSNRLSLLFLTLVNSPRITLDICLCTPSPVSIDICQNARRIWASISPPPSRHPTDR